MGRNGLATRFPQSFCFPKKAKQKQLKLMEQTDVAMERPAQEDYSALKTAKEALETKFVDVRVIFGIFISPFFR